MPIFSFYATISESEATDSLIESDDLREVGGWLEPHPTPTIWRNLLVFPYDFFSLGHPCRVPQARNQGCDRNVDSGCWEDILYKKGSWFIIRNPPPAWCVSLPPPPLTRGRSQFPDSAWLIRYYNGSKRVSSTESSLL